jgi:hypothetical protein
MDGRFRRTLFFFIFGLINRGFTMQATNGGLYFLFALATVASSGHSPPGKLRRDTCEYFLVLFGTPPPHSHPLLAKN